METGNNLTSLTSYERLLWNLMCRRNLLNGRYSANKAKRLCILAYCLYYRGVTVSQIMLAKMSDSMNPSVIRTTMSKYSTSDIRCCLVPPSHIAGDVAGLPPVKESDAKKPYYMHQVRYGKMTYNVYELSEYGVKESIYELLDLPTDFLAGVNQDILAQLAKRYRKKKSLSLSDEAAHFLSVRDFGAYCYSQLDFRPFAYYTECRFFQNGEFMSGGASYNRAGAFASTAQICDGYIEYFPISGSPTDNMSIYVEQDMGTQSRGYIRKNKLAHYLDFVRYSFRKHPVYVSVLFLLQTRAEFQLHEDGREKSCPQQEQYKRYAPALRQEIMIRAYENFGDRWCDFLLKELREKTMGTIRGCPAVRKHLLHEIELFDEILLRNPHATIGDCLSCIGAGQRKQQEEQSDLSARDRFYFKTRRLEFFEESLRIPGFNDVLLEGFSVMFAHNNSISEQIPCLLPEMSAVSRTDQSDVFPHSLANVRMGYMVSKLFSHPQMRLEYRPYISSKEHLFRNYYFDRGQDMHVVLENISDDLGGRARVIAYLNEPSFSSFHGYLLCLVEDDWLAPGKLPLRKQRVDYVWPEIAESAYAKYLVDYKNQNMDPFEMMPLRVMFVKYRAYLSGMEDASDIQELSVCNGNIQLTDFGVRG